MITHIGQRVQLRYASEHKGTVYRLSKGWFGVVYDSPADRYRKTGEPRSRFLYPMRNEDSFVPETFEETRLLEEEES